MIRPSVSRDFLSDANKVAPLETNDSHEGAVAYFQLCSDRLGVCRTARINVAFDVERESQYSPSYNDTSTRSLTTAAQSLRAGRRAVIVKIAWPDAADVSQSGMILIVGNCVANSVVPRASWLDASSCQQPFSYIALASLGPFMP